MIVTNLKIKAFSKKKGYDKNYALNYLERRKKDFDKSQKYFYEMFNQFNINLKGKVILDLAAGIGMDLKILNQFKPKVLIWHDKMEGPYKVARENLRGINNVIFNKKDLMDLEEYKDNSVDCIICRDSLYYIGNDYYFFKHIKRILKQKGYFWATNSTFKYYNSVSKENFLKRIRHQFFDWPLYKFTGLRLLSFLPVDKNRVNYIFKKLNFNILFLKEKEDQIEFLIKK